MSEIRPRRSLIFVPGLRPEMFSKALGAGADIVCVDLEDAIAPEDKDAARARTLELFETLPDVGNVEPMVRINGLRTPDGLKDLTAILESTCPPAALMLPKIKAPEDIHMLEELLAEQATRFHVIIETNDGLNAAYEIAQSSGRIDALLFGAVDMSAELRVVPEWGPLLYARQRLVHAAARAGVDLIDVPFLDLEDQAGLGQAAAQAAELGFTGKAAIHPKQIAAINAAFTPTEKEINYAKRVIAAFEAGEGGLVMVDGKLIEKPVLRSMYRILAVAGAI